MDWAWIVEEELVEGESGYYTSGDAKPEEVNHAIETAYLAANDEQRRKLVDMIWEEKGLTSDATYWYTKRDSEVQDLATAYSGVSVTPGGTSGAGSDLLLPGNAQLWLNTDTDQKWVIYEVPGVTLPDGTTSEPVFTSWLVESDADLEAVVGPGKEPTYHFTGTEADFTAKGVIDLGGVDELRVSDLEGDPFDTWVEDMTTLAAVAPWILDDDYVALVVQAAMERVDGQISLEEIQGTNWWKDNTAGQRLWMETWFSDRKTAEQMLDDNRTSMKYQLAQAGINNASPELVNWMADKTTMGAWSMNKLQSQIAAIADPYSVDTIDDELFEFMASGGIDLDHTRTEEGTVRGLLEEWLGPVYGQWTEEQIATKAGELRNNPDGKIEFIESLKDQRMSMFPEHADRNLSYQSIAQPWRAYSQGIWGAPIEDTDEVFQQVLRANDPREAGKLLRKAGLDRGYDKTISDVVQGMQTGMKSNVRGAV